MKPFHSRGHVVIACGGTGGHLFPGIAVGLELRSRGCDVTLLVSTKDVDQAGVAAVRNEFKVMALPAVGLSSRNSLRFIRGSFQAWRAVRRLFQSAPPHAVLAMGGFTSFAPVWVGRRTGAATLLHESNTIPGRANRLLAPWVDECLVGFSQAGALLANPRQFLTGTPVRPGFFTSDPKEARERLGLDARYPVLLVMGGSQGASGINRRMAEAYAGILQGVPGCQWVHLAGASDFARVELAAKNWPGHGRVLAFSSDMEGWMTAATAAVSRAGASSLAELAAVRLPAVLIPYPYATGNHQTHNARVFAAQGAAVTLPEAEATPERLVELLVPLLQEPSVRNRMQTALASWATPEAAARIADRVAEGVRRRYPRIGFFGGHVERRLMPASPKGREVYT